MFRSNKVKQELRAGKTVFGASLTLAHPCIAEMIGIFGYDFVLIDAEHGLGDYRDHLACLQAIATTPAHGIVRMESHDVSQIQRILDVGAEGIMVPAVSSAEEARALVAACRYPPRGTRGYAASGIRGSDYGMATVRYLAEVEQELLVCVMVETVSGVESIDEIARVDGVDVIQIGANDLAYDLGIPEQLDHPRLESALRIVEDAAKRHGRRLGGAPRPGVTAMALRGKGYGLITLGRDAGLLTGALKSTLEAAKLNPSEGEI